MVEQVTIYFTTRALTPILKYYLYADDSEIYTVINNNILMAHYLLVHCTTGNARLCRDRRLLLLVRAMSPSADLVHSADLEPECNVLLDVLTVDGVLTEMTASAVLPLPVCPQP